ncbi:MAG: dTMP kinase [Patescibacteria group bacterium]
MARPATWGKFIVVDGGDGTGKTSVIDFLKEELKGGDILFTREPGGTGSPLAEEIRGVVLRKRDERVFAETELMLFSAARLQHVGNFVLPALRRGNHVISDRFSSSTIAYQLYGNGRLDLQKFFDNLDRVATSGCVPDLYILLDVDSEEAMRRRHSAGATSRFDERELAFHKAVRAGFLETANRFPRSVIVDAGKSEADVKQNVLDEILKFLN